MGHNIKHIKNTTAEKCQKACTKNKKCLGVEFFRESGAARPSKAFKEGDCLLNDATDLVEPPCDADFY